MTDNKNESHNESEKNIHPTSTNINAGHQSAVNSSKQQVVHLCDLSTHPVHKHSDLLSSSARQHSDPKLEVDADVSLPSLPDQSRREPTENVDPGSLVDTNQAVRQATEHDDPDTGDEYRRMMSEEIGRQWEDETSMSARSWSLGPSESGYGSRVGHCRKCEVADDMFLCPESRLFWKKIRGGVCCKRVWRDFCDEIKTMFPMEDALKKKRVLKMFRCLLGVQHQELNDVTVENYLNFIRFFGPFRAEENRCVAIKQLEELVENSFQLSKNNRAHFCWFAGSISRQEAENKLKEQTPGTFLVRMSITDQIEGCFVVSVVMADGLAEHFQIKGHPEEAVTTHPFSQELEFKGQQFSSLHDVVNNCLRLDNVFDSEDPKNGVRCCTVCPNLPFNHILDGYK